MPTPIMVSMSSPAVSVMKSIALSAGSGAEAMEAAASQNEEAIFSPQGFGGLRCSLFCTNQASLSSHQRAPMCTHLGRTLLRMSSAERPATMSSRPMPAPT